MPIGVSRRQEKMMLVAALVLSVVIAAAILGVGISMINEPNSRVTTSGDAANAIILIWGMVIPVALAAASAGNNVAAWSSAVWLTGWALYISARAIMKIGRAPKTITKKRGIVIALVNFSFLFAVIVTLGVVMS